MGVTKTIREEGSGPKPEAHQTVTIEYSGWLKNADGSKGEKFDSSVGRGDFVVRIGEQKVIRGWDEGVMSMQLGEKATLDITPDYAYGGRGFPRSNPQPGQSPWLIAPNSTLIFDVHLKKIN